MERYDEAVAELERAAAVEKPDGVILDHLADAYFKAGATDKARATWQRAIAAFAAENEQDKQQATQKKLDQHK